MQSHACVRELTWIEISGKSLDCYCKFHWELLLDPLFLQGPWSILHISILESKWGMDTDTNSFSRVHLCLLPKNSFLIDGHFFYAVILILLDDCQDSCFLLPSWFQVPICLYFMTHAYFCFYHAFSNILIRRVSQTTSLLFVDSIAGLLLQNWSCSMWFIWPERVIPYTHSYDMPSSQEVFFPRILLLVSLYFSIRTSWHSWRQPRFQV